MTHIIKKIIKNISKFFHDNLHKIVVGVIVGVIVSVIVLYFTPEKKIESKRDRPYIDLDENGFEILKFSIDSNAKFQPYIDTNSVLTYPIRRKDRISIDTSNIEMLIKEEFLIRNKDDISIDTSDLENLFTEKFLMEYSKSPVMDFILTIKNPTEEFANIYFCLITVRESSTGDPRLIDSILAGKLENLNYGNVPKVKGSDHLVLKPKNSLSKYFEIAIPNKENFTIHILIVYYDELKNYYSFYCWINGELNYKPPYYIPEYIQNKENKLELNNVYYQNLPNYKNPVAILSTPTSTPRALTEDEKKIVIEFWKRESK